jgi:hypothetical protein
MYLSDILINNERPREVVEENWKLETVGDGSGMQPEQQLGDQRLRICCVALPAFYV